MRFIAEDVNEKAIKRYWLMTTKALQRVLEINKEDRRNNCFYEIMPSPECTYRYTCKACEMKLKQYGTRAYLDLEFPDPCDWESFDTSDSDKASLGEEIANAFGQYLQDTYECTAEPRIMKSHRPGKYSWHIVFACTRNGKEILFRNSLTLLTAIKDFFHKGLAKPYVYYSNEGDEEKNVIDESVYSTHKLYRTLHSQKYGRLTGSFVVEQGPDTFEEHLVLQPIQSDTLFFDLEQADSTTKINAKRKRTHQGNIKKHLKTNLKESTPSDSNREINPAEAIFRSLQAWKDTFAFLKRKFPTLEEYKVQIKSLTKVYIPLDKDHRCPMKRGSGPNGEHRNNHSAIFFYPALGNIYWKCHKSECHKLGGSLKLALPMNIKQQWKKLYNMKHPVPKTLSSIM